MNITNRDIEIFKLIANYGMLSSKQINSICFNSIATTTVLRRLRMLEDKRYIQRLLGLESQDVLWILLPGEIRLSALKKASQGSSKLSPFTERMTGLKVNDILK